MAPHRFHSRLHCASCQFKEKEAEPGMVQHYTHNAGASSLLVSRHLIQDELQVLIRKAHVLVIVRGL